MAKTSAMASGDDVKKGSKKKGRLQTLLAFARKHPKDIRLPFVILFLVIGVSFGAAMLARTDEVVFAQSSTLETNEFKLIYPGNWGVAEDGNSWKITPPQGEQSASFEVTRFDTVPGYAQLSSGQRDQLVEQALAAVRSGSEDVTTVFSRIDLAEVELGSHPAADRAITFRYEGELDGGISSVRSGHMIVGSDGQTYVVVVGAERDLFEEKTTAFQRMLNGFRFNQQ
jgi:hypothetical protein